MVHWATLNSIDKGIKHLFPLFGFLIPFSSSLPPPSSSSSLCLLHPPLAHFIHKKQKRPPARGARILSPPLVTGTCLQLLQAVVPHAPIPQPSTCCVATASLRFRFHVKRVSHVALTRLSNDVKVVKKVQAVI